MSTKKRLVGKIVRTPAQVKWAEQTVRLKTKLRLEAAAEQVKDRCHMHKGKDYIMLLRLADNIAKVAGRFNERK